MRPPVQPSPSLSAPYLEDPAFADRPDALHVVAILPTLNPYGGVVSVVNLLEELLEMGNRYTLVSLSEIPQSPVHPRSEPIYIADRSKIAHALRTDVDVVMATSWETVEPAVALAERSGAVAAYFVQDIEADFYPDDRTKRLALSTYGQIGLRFVKTAHLQRRLADLGFDAHRIPPGMNLDVFYRRDVPRHDNPRVLAMARPGQKTDHRGFDIVKAVFTELATRRPDVDLVLFGTDDVGRLPFEHTNAGRLTPEALPALYSSADVFLDASRAHGFGRTGVEAMACGCACVLSDSGGISEYARHGENALVVPVSDVDATVGAIERLLDDEPLRRRVVEEGRKTVERFAEPIAAEVMLSVLRPALAKGTS